MAWRVVRCGNVLDKVALSGRSLNGHRRIWHWLNIVWNRVDDKRIAEVGPDRACAEWLMRNGACVKWTDDYEFLKDYNALPAEGDVRYIHEVDATDSSIMHYGFEYFMEDHNTHTITCTRRMRNVHYDVAIHKYKNVGIFFQSSMFVSRNFSEGCKYITRIKFHRCLYLKDEALENLSYLKDSLEDLQIISCGNITDKGVKSLHVLSKLLSLRIYDLVYLKNKEECMTVLKSNLPNCNIEILDRVQAAK